MSSKENRQVVYIMVPKKIVIALVSILIVLFITILSSFQYANWVDRQSNRKLCGIIDLSNEASKEQPPVSELQKRGAAAMVQLANDYKC